MKIEYGEGPFLEIIEVPDDLEITQSLENRLGGRNQALLHMNLYIVTTIKELSKSWGIKICTDNDADIKKAYLANLKRAADKRGLLFTVENTATGVIIHPAMSEKGVFKGIIK